jgi:hypothetical protein
MLSTVVWVAVAWLAVLTAACVYGVSHLVPEMSPHLPQELLFQFIHTHAFPRRVEQAQYITAILVPSLSFLILAIAFRKSFYSLAERYKNRERYWITGSLVIQAILGVLVIRLWRVQEKYVHSYFGMQALAKSALIGGFVLALFLAWPQLKDRFVSVGVRERFFSLFKKRRMAIVPAVIFAAIAGVQLLGSVFTETNLPLVATTISAHMDHTQGEFISVFYGKTPWVDFFPQYQVVLPYLTWPYFKLFGTGVLSFTSLMGLLSFAGLWSLFWVLQRVTRSSWSALLLSLPWVYLGFYSSFATGDPSAPNAFNYYAMWPLRFVMPCLTLGFLVRALEKGTARSLLFAFSFGTLGMINNLDFGFPALVGCFAAVVISDLKVYLESPPRLLETLKPCLAGVALGILGFVFFTWVRSGHFPNPTEQLEFQKAFGLLGFMGGALPGQGAYQLVYLSYLSSFLLAIYLGFTGKGSQIQKAVLSFIAVFGCGAFLYFITRPDSQNLNSHFVPWAFSVSVLLYSTLSGETFKKMEWKRLNPAWLSVIPALVLLSHYFIFLSTTKPMHSLPKEIARFKKEDESYVKERFAELRFIQERVRPLEKVGLMMPNAEWYASETRVKNVYIYGQLYSLFFKKQADQIVRHYADENAEKVFIVVTDTPVHYSELKDRLSQNHFVFRDKMALHGWLVLEYWEKEKTSL